MEEALADERRAEQSYERLADEVGPLPFRHLEEAEDRHATMLERLLAAHGHPTPEPRASASAPAAASRAEACALGAKSERDNIALYDGLLARDLPADVRCVFERLRAASRDRHLPAFERCAAR